MTFPGRREFEAAHAIIRPHIHHTPLLTSRMLSDATGFDARLKAEIFQRTGSYKIRGPLNKFTHLTDEEFWEALDIYQGPIWASHSDCRSRPG